VGLALAQQIARAHGGEIRLANREDGEGARATVRLPEANS
jgi:signal transduction histidine kinase